jgi:hypothetical protein
MLSLDMLMLPVGQGVVNDLTYSGRPTCRDLKKKEKHDFTTFATSSFL